MAKVPEGWNSRAGQTPRASGTRYGAILMGVGVTLLSAGPHPQPQGPHLIEKTRTRSLTDAPETKQVQSIIENQFNHQRNHNPNKNV